MAIFITLSHVIYDIPDTILIALQRTSDDVSQADDVEHKHEVGGTASERQSYSAVLHVLLY